MPKILVENLEKGPKNPKRDNPETLVEKSEYTLKEVLFIYLHWILIQSHWGDGILIGIHWASLCQIVFYPEYPTSIKRNWRIRVIF